MGRKKMSPEEKKPKIKVVINEILMDKIDDIAKKENINRSQFIEKILIEKINKL